MTQNCDVKSRSATDRQNSRLSGARRSRGYHRYCQTTLSRQTTLTVPPAKRKVVVRPGPARPPGPARLGSPSSLQSAGVGEEDALTGAADAFMDLRSKPKIVTSRVRH